MQDKTIIPIMSQVAGGFVAYPCATTTAKDFPLQSVLRTERGAAVNYHVHAGSIWEADAERAAPTPQQWFDKCRATDRVFRIDELGDWIRADVVEECAAKVQNYLVVDGGIHSSSMGPTLVGSRLGSGRPWFRGVRMTRSYVRSGPELTEFLIGGCQLDEGVAAVLAAFPRARIEKNYEHEIVDPSLMLDEAAPLGAELALWTFLCHTRTKALADSTQLEAVVMIREFMARRYENDRVDLDWESPRPDMLNNVYREFPKGSEGLSDLLSDLVETVQRDGGSDLLPLMALARDRMVAKDRAIAPQDIESIGGISL